MGQIREGANRASAEEAASFASELDRMEQDRENRLAQLDAEYKAKKLELNTAINGEQKGILSDAKKVGVKKGVLRAIYVGQKGIRKAEELLVKNKEKAVNGVDELEGDDREYTVDILTALGDEFASVGLGKAAVEREKKPRKKEPDAAGISKHMETLN